MRGLLVFVALVAVAAAAVRVRLDSQEVRLNKLTARFQRLSDSVDSSAGGASASVGKVEALNYRLDDAVGDGCAKGQFQCGGSVRQCVSLISVCDGTSNCVNGADEEVCDSPLAAGSSWVGTTVYDYCTRRKPETITLVINSFETKPYFTNKAYVGASFMLSTADDDESESVFFISEGTYCYGCRLLSTNPPESDDLGLTCKFDQGDDSKCTGYIVRQATQEKCAKFAFVKQ